MLAGGNNVDFSAIESTSKKVPLKQREFFNQQN